MSSTAPFLFAAVITSDKVMLQEGSKFIAPASQLQERLPNTFLMVRRPYGFAGAMINFFHLENENFSC